VSRLIINSYAPLRFCYATQTKALVSTGGGCGSAVPHCQALAPRASHSTATVSRRCPRAAQCHRAGSFWRQSLTGNPTQSRQEEIQHTRQPFAMASRRHGLGFPEKTGLLRAPLLAVPNEARARRRNIAAHTSLASTVSQDCSDDRKVHSQRLCALGDRHRRNKRSRSPTSDSDGHDRAPKHHKQSPTHDCPIGSGVPAVHRAVSNNELRYAMTSALDAVLGAEIPEFEPAPRPDSNKAAASAKCPLELRGCS